jgi:catechol 2,3-dioxygenase-like lactoylglutathione lyase family enzyme
MRLGQAMLFVHDAARMQAFYAKTFALEVVDGDATSGFVRLADPAGGATLAIHATAAVGPPGKPRRNACVKLCFQVDDIDAGRAALAAAGASPGDIRRFEGIAFCDALDPEGNVIQITTRS